MSILAQNIIVGIIILAALAWIIVKLVRARKKGSLGCSCCSMANSCPHSGEASSPNSPKCKCPGEASSPNSPKCPHCHMNESKPSNHHEINKNLE